MIDYSLFRKRSVKPDEVPSLGPWDVFISAFTLSDRVSQVHANVRATAKHWLVFPEYSIPLVSLPPANVFTSSEREEDVFVNAFLGGVSLKGRVCVDTTGFLRPHLLFLMRALIAMDHLDVVDFLYSEPGYYRHKERTVFSSEAVEDVRPVRGFEGSANPAAKDVLIIGAGYDPHLVSTVCLKKESARKTVLVGFPPLKPEMYQESVLRISAASEHLGIELEDTNAMHYVPANDPFVTAEVLQRLVADERTARGPDVNIYLCPLATKAQALGFGLFFECELAQSSASILFPFSTDYSPETSKGIGRVWQFAVETKVIRTLQAARRATT